MGYDVHITRKENWFDEDNSREISIEEWKEYVANDPDMRLDSYAEAATTGGEKITVVSDGLCVWTKYRGNGVDGNYAWFSFSAGCIVVKNPDEEIIDKMIKIALFFNAKVQGDEGEIYIKNGNDIKSTEDSQPGNYASESKKPWWKFWQ